MVFIFMVVVVMVLLLAFAFGTIFFCFFFFFVAAVTDFVLLEDTAFIGFLFVQELVIDSVGSPSHFLLFSPRC
jgi:hypothetical protein